MKAIAGGENGIYKVVAEVQKQEKTTQMGRTIVIQDAKEKLTFIAYAQWRKYLEAQRSMNPFPLEIMSRVHTLRNL